ncbi:M36 family metallopeptidase [Lysobacter sp. CFH 32150]|nr:M36 family metallopeptidase [Lysobacter sp. CFH 32150]
MPDGTLSTGFLVETWRLSGNLLHETVVDGNGRVIEVVKRTNTDSYNVFTVDPTATPQAIVAGPGGWLFGGTHRSIDIAGNNAHAYLDAVNDSVPDAGGTSVADGNFLTAFDTGIQPSAGENPNVAVQNLFYLNNVIHDRLYLAGFDEAAGNFQEDNFGLGGRGSDSVNAEAQDGGGTDNANFATPRDGNNPRMQMYLWSSPLPDHEVLINAPAELAGTSYAARRAAFGGSLDATGLTDDVVLVNDGTGTTTDACEPIANAADVADKVALIDRGTCTFVIKVKNAQNAGAVGVIMVNNQGNNPIVMGGTDATITIPAVMIGQSNGGILKAATGVNATLRLLDPAPIMQDSALDSDIVWHEYGHGLTWRMIGHMSGPLSGAIGEGMSDVLAIIINDDDVVAEYSFADPGGIRSAPYANYSRTYGDIVGAEVHFDGEVYGAIGWRLWKNFQGAGVSKDDTLAFIVDGMNYTQAYPSFENMRDGILAATAGSGHECLVWDAFADYGVGVGARGKAKSSALGVSVIVTESFALPAGCTAIP